MKKNMVFTRLVTFAIATFMSLSAISMISVTVKAEPIVDGVISSGEYDGGLYIPLIGPWPPGAPFSPAVVDCYVYWDARYFYIAVNEPVPNWGTASGDNFIEFMWDPGSFSSTLHAWVLWDNGWWSHVQCEKPGCWYQTGDPFPGTSLWAVNSATEFKFDYTLYGTSYGDTIKLIIDTSENAHLYPPFGDCQTWPANPTYYPCETASSIATWGTIVLSDRQPPTADAGGPYTGPTGASIVLDGSGSSDLDGTIVSYEWDLDHDGSYDDATGSTTSQSWSSEGTYTVSLKVTDDDGLFDTDDSTVNIGDHVVDGVIAPDEYDGGMAVELVAGTWTVDAYIDWDCQYMYVAVNETVPAYIEFGFDAGSARDRFDLFCLFPSGSSNYQYCLKSGGSWSGPTTSPSSFSAFSNTETEFKFDYTAFGIVMGDTIKMCIERGSSPNAYWPKGGVIWSAPGYRPDPSTWGEVTLSGSCNPLNIPPAADFTYNPSSPTILDIIQFTDASTDSDGTIVSWSWSFGDGITSTLKNPSHQYTNGGTYSVTLAVTDDDGASNSISKNVVVISLDQGQTKNSNAFTIYSTNKGAQSFIPTVTTLTHAEVFMRKVGNPPSNIVVSVRSSLTGANLVSLSIPASQISTTFGWVLFDFSDIHLTPGNPYYLVLNTYGGSTMNYYSIGYSTGNLYKNGALSTCYYGNLWFNNLGYDLCFKTYGFT